MAFNWFKKKETPSQKRSSSFPPKPDETVAPSENNSAPVPAPSPTSNEPEKAQSAVLSSQTETVSADHPASADKIDAKPDSKAQNSAQSIGFLDRLKQGLSKTRDILTTDIEEIFNGKSGIDDEMLEELEELLITADMGVATTMDLMEKIEKKAAKISGPEDLQRIIKNEIVALFEDLPPEPQAAVAKPRVVMVIGVNGVGKTTTIGKLAAKAKQTGDKVLIAAADTFRAAAIEQLSVWAERSGAEIVKHKSNADPAAVAYDSVEAAIARKVDTVFVDTAGRLHTRVNLMEELKKIQRTIAKKIPDAPHEILLVLDATTGQNALSQAKLFNEAIGITGLVLTKLDGTAKGGIVVSICTTLNLPLKYIGVGENIEDLQIFDPQRFVDALL